MTSPSPTVYLLSPASCAGKRAAILLANVRAIPLAARLQSAGAAIGEVFAFMSTLYFRGKLEYADRFGMPPPGWSPALVIAPGLGLVPADFRIRTSDLRSMAGVPVDPADPRYREPLVRDALALAHALGPRGCAVLLGSIATDKYVGPLAHALGDRLRFPAAFVGRGDMSRGGLLLRCTRTGKRLEYVPVGRTGRHGPRPPRLPALTDQEEIQ